MPRPDDPKGGGQGPAAILPAVEALLGLEAAPAEPKARYRIGELAEEFGITLRALRFYEDRGMLKPERDGRTRLYSDADRRRLRMVLLGKALGFSLAEIASLAELYGGPPDERAPQRLGEVLKRLETQKQVLLGQRSEIETSIRAMDAAIGVLKDRRGTPA